MKSAPDYLTMEKYDAVVIGGGIGGTVIGALLSYHGLRTLLLERTEVIGGRAKTYDFDGFKLDVGGHSIPNPDTNSIRVVVDTVRADLQLVASGPIMFYDWVDKTFYPFEDFASKRFSPEEVGEVKRFQKIVSSMSLEEINNFQGISLKEWLERIGAKQDLLSRLFVLATADPSQVSAAVFLRFYHNRFNSKMKIAYSKGGIQEIPKSMARVIQRHGGDVVTNASVQRVIIEDGAARGVEIQIAPPGSSYSHTAEVESDIVVSAIPVETLFNIIPRETCPKEFVELAERCGRAPRQKTVGIVAAVKKELLKPSWFEIAVKPRQAERPGRICFIPTVPSPELAPADYHYFQYESMSFDPRLVQEKEAIRDELKEDIVAMYPNIEFKWLHGYYSSCRSYSYNLDFSDSMAPDVQIDGIKNLYFSGDQFRGMSDSGITGIDRAFSSARYCFNRIMSDRGKNIAV
jgi:phytoene dehydrogenase-like protein